MLTFYKGVCVESTPFPVNWKVIVHPYFCCCSFSSDNLFLCPRDETRRNVSSDRYTLFRPSSLFCGKRRQILLFALASPWHSFGMASILFFIAKSEQLWLRISFSPYSYLHQRVQPGGKKDREMVGNKT